MSQLLNFLQKLPLVLLMLLYGWSNFLQYSAVTPYPSAKTTQQQKYEKQEIAQQLSHVIFAKTGIPSGPLQTLSKKWQPVNLPCHLLSIGTLVSYQHFANHNFQVFQLLQGRYAELLYPFHTFW